MSIEAIQRDNKAERKSVSPLCPPLHPIHPKLPLGDAWSLREAMQYCAWLASRHYENFPVASLLLPKRLRPHVANIYAFARTADDFADEKEFSGKRLAYLEWWQQELLECTNKSSEHPIFLALAHTIERHDIPVQLLLDLLFAFKMDVTVERYAEFDQLLYYCKHSANPVGRLVLHLFGYCDEQRAKLSDCICTALQLANFWQDVSVDLVKPRVYLPEEDLKSFDYDYDELNERVYNPAFRRLIRFQVERTRNMFQEGAQLISQVRGQLAWELKLTVLGGLSILDKIEKQHYNVLRKRPTVSTIDKLRLFGRSLLPGNRWLAK